ncbi:MAG: S-adenosylmethionine decarboxylase [Rhodospirillaceae bacterium]
MDQISSKDGYKRIVVDGQRYYGRHVMVDSTLCNERLLELNDVNQFVADLVKRIDMVAYGNIVSARFGGGIETGISAVQLIETSAISLHTNDAARDLYLDVFSCKDFKAGDVVDIVTEYFAPDSMNVRDVLRK